MNKLRKRIITGIVYGVTLISSLLAGPSSYVIFFYLVMFFMLREFYRITEKTKSNPQKTFGIIISSLIYFGSAANFLKPSISFLLFLLAFTFTFVLFVTELFRFKDNSINNLGSTILGIVYIAFPMSLLNYLAFDSLNIYNYETILALFILVWLSDTGGFIIGIKFGKNRLLEKISPKKSWEGAIGSLVFCILGGIVISIFYSDYTMIEWSFLGLIVCVTAISGDLIESMFKRNAGVKDAGTLLPGHGGFLDRFDSVIFVIPFVYLFQILFS
jgi:phosphatidate cytidylyltransferase